MVHGWSLGEVRPKLPRVSPTEVTQDMLNSPSNEVRQRLGSVVHQRRWLETWCLGFLLGAGYGAALARDAPKFQTPRRKMCSPGTMLFCVNSLGTARCLKCHMLPWHLWASQKPKSLTMNSPALTRYVAHPKGKSLYLASSPTSYTSCIPSGPQPHGCTSLSIHRIIETSQLHPPAGTMGTSTSCCYKACHPQPWLVLFAPQHNAVWSCTACDVLLPQGVSRCDWLAAAKVICPVLGTVCSVISYALGWDIPH